MFKEEENCLGQFLGWVYVYRYIWYKPTGLSRDLFDAETQITSTASVIFGGMISSSMKLAMYDYAFSGTVLYKGYIHNSVRAIFALSKATIRLRPLHRLFALDSPSFTLPLTSPIVGLLSTAPALCFEPRSRKLLRLGATPFSRSTVLLLQRTATLRLWNLIPRPARQISFSYLFPSPFPSHLSPLHLSHPHPLSPPSSSPLHSLPLSRKIPN